VGVSKFEILLLYGFNLFHNGAARTSDTYQISLFYAAFENTSNYFISLTFSSFSVISVSMLS